MNCKAHHWPSSLRGMIRQQCSRKATKDGYCWQHHPDAVKKRKEAARKKSDEDWQNSNYMQLQRANDEIKMLKRKIKRLENKRWKTKPSPEEDLCPECYGFGVVPKYE